MLCEVNYMKKKCSIFSNAGLYQQRELSIRNGIFETAYVFN